MTLPLFVYGKLKRSAAGTPHALLRDGRKRAAWTYALRRRPQNARALLSGRYQPKRGAA